VKLRGRIVLTAALLAGGLLVPSAASAHAYLVKTVPAASVVLNAPPPNVQLTYDEAVEPRFAIISVTNAQGQQEATGAPQRSPATPDTLVVPLRPHLPEGWYLIYWRAISVDGHPVNGAFTYAVGPNPGPAPQFRVPSVSATATTPGLLITRWLMFVTVMASIGLFVLRAFVARPMVRRIGEMSLPPVAAGAEEASLPPVAERAEGATLRPDAGHAEGASLRGLNAAFLVASVLALIAIPVYLDFSIANDTLRSVFDLSALVPLYRATAFGRAIVDLELCFALFAVAAWISLWVDRPERERRSIAELAATTGALLAAAAVTVVPGAAGHAAQTSPGGLTIALDWVHVSAGAVWLGGLIGLLVLWRTTPARTRVDALSVVVPRFSNVALASVVLLAGAGVGEAIVHMPTVNALWKTGYGVAILVKAGLLGAALLIASGNLLRSKPWLVAARARPELGVPTARPELGAPAATLLRRLVAGEVVVVLGIVFAAALLSSLAPPPPAFALQSSALAQVGPGRVARIVTRSGYVLQVLVSPNKAAAPDSFALRITRNDQPVRGANVTLTFNHTEMQMPQQEYQLSETRPGVYARAAPALVMVGKWALSFQVTPAGGTSFTALILDQASG
jgi:copper transport protein